MNYKTIDQAEIIGSLYETLKIAQRDMYRLRRDITNGVLKLEESHLQVRLNLIHHSMQAVVMECQQCGKEIPSYAWRYVSDEGYHYCDECGEILTNANDE